MLPLNIDQVKGWFQRQNTIAFTILDNKSGERIEHFNSTTGKGEKEETAGSVEETVLKFNEYISYLSAGIYRVETWKKGGQSNKLTQVFAIGSVSNNVNQSQNFGGAIDPNFLMNYGALQKQMELQQQIWNLQQQLLAKKKTVKKEKPSPFKNIAINALSALFAGEKVQTAIANQIAAMSTEQFKELNERMISFAGGGSDEEEDEDENEDD